MANFKCIVCDSKFLERSAFETHVGTTDLAALKVHSCDKCDQTFCKAASLEAHQRDNSHTRITKCSACEKRFGSRKAFRQHTSKCWGFSQDTKAKKHYKSSYNDSKSSKFSYGHERSYSNWRSYGHELDFGNDLSYGLCDKECGWCGRCEDLYTGPDY